MTKRMVIMLAAVAVVFGGVFGFQMFKAAMIKKFMSQMAQPPQTVTAGKASFSAWQPKIAAVGTLRAVKGADLSLEVAGVVDEIAFSSGDDVEAGVLLLKLRSDDDLAKLQSLQATAELNEITFERDQKQLKLQAVQARLTSLWEVTLYPVPGQGGPPLWVVVPGRDSRQTTDAALQQNPGYVAGPVRRVAG